MELKREFIPLEAVENLESQLLELDGPYERIVLESQGMCYAAIQIHCGRGVMQANAVPYPLLMREAKRRMNVDRIKCIHLPPESRETVSC